MADSRLPASKTFPAARFRDAIRGVYEMAATPDEQRATFCWNPKASTDATADSTGVAFDPSIVPTVTQKAPVVVPCGVEYVQATDDPSNFGTLLPSRIKITLLDEDYTIVADSDYVMLENEKYTYHHDEPPFGLFQVGIHVLVYEAEGER